jgi:peptide/nickel transport system substrate-binding protein
MLELTKLFARGGGFMFKKLLFLSLAVFVILFAVACSNPDQEPADDGAPTGTGESTNEIVIALQSDGDSLDPHKATQAASMRLIENMYSTLVRFADGTYGEIEPDLAREYSVSEDATVYTFYLHEGVMFHNSEREVTSEDVKYSIERIIENEVRANQFAAVAEIETPDPYTVVFRLSEPVAPFLTYLAYPMNVIVNEEVVSANNGSLDNVDAGCGPFQLVEWSKDQHLILEKNPGYFVAGLPYLDRVIFRPIPDETARTTALRNKEIDLILDVTYRDVQVLEGAESVVLESVPGTFWEYIGINTTVAPFDDVRVRQALAHAIDREEINQMIKFGRATVLDGGVIPPGHWAYADISLYPKRDLEKAKELLTEAGYPDGFEAVLKVGSDFEYQVDAAQLVKQQLSDVGIQLEVLAQESGIFFDALGNSEFQLTIVGWLGFIDPDEYLYNIFYSDAMWNQQVYSNSEVDRLLDEGRRTSDQDERKAIYVEAQRIIADEAPMAFLYMNERTAAMLERVEGFDVNPTVTTISLRSTKVK